MNGRDGGIYARVIKRILDFTVAVFALVVLSPVFLILTIIGAIAMKGNPFFVQARPGKKNKYGEEKIFNLIKFRTMTNQKDAQGNFLPDEIRLNGYGKFLRNTSLDEICEIINIITGDMSFVGPRPLLVRYLPLYSQQQRRRHDVRPGLTGYAQVNGRNAISWNDKFMLDTYYVDNISFKNDIKIILLTVKTVVGRTGISSDTSATMEEFLGNDDAELVSK